MKQKIILIVKRIPPLYKIALFIVKLMRHIINIKVYRRKTRYFFLFCKRTIRRLEWLDSPKYKKLKMLKNIHYGKRCFIVCTGPSLRLDDLEKLKNEICFSMNSAFYLFDKTSWRPEYYCLSKMRIFDAPISGAIQSGDITNLFISDHSRKRPYEHNSAASIYRLVLLHVNKKPSIDESGNIIPVRGYRFSDDIYRGISGGTSTVTTALQIAAYMGFKEIYLYGADCDYGGKEKHFKGLEYLSESVYAEHTVPKSQKIVLWGHKIAKEFADTSDFTIYNATRGGALEVYERVDLDEVLASKSSASDKE